MRRQDIKQGQTNTAENSDTVAVKEKLGVVGKKTTSWKHFWRTTTDAKDSHLCLRNHFCSLFRLCLSCTHSDSLFSLYICSLCHGKIQAWQLRTRRPFGKNICSCQCAEPRWEDLKQRESVALNKTPIYADITCGGFSLLILSSKHAGGLLQYFAQE